MIRWLKRYVTTVLGTAAVLATLSLHHGLKSQTLEDKPSEAATIGVSFRLASSNGGTIDSETLKGTPYGLFFGFTHCPEICPTTLYEMSKALKELGPEAKDFRVFFVTVDPERDTAAKLKDYLGNFDPRIEALVPTAGQLSQIAKAFNAVYEKVPTSDGSYTMGHTVTVYLVNRDGKLVDETFFGDYPEQRLAKLRKLIGL
jgi:protein SCO1/2